MFASLKKAINNFINKLAKESKNTFGDEPLDCCKLDRPKSSNK